MANYVDYTPANASGSLLSLADNAQAIAERITALCAEVKSKESRALSTAINAVPSALAAIPQAVADGLALVERPEYKAQDKHSASTRAIGAAQARAIDTLNAAVRAADACRASLEGSFSVKQPTGDPMLAFHAQQIAQLIEQKVGNNPAQLPHVVGDLLHDALARGATTEAYVLTQALWPTYARLGASGDTATALRKVIAAALGASKSQDPDNAGATLLAELSEQGGAFLKFVQSVRHLITSNAQPALDRINGALATGGMSNGPLAYTGR